LIKKEFKVINNIYSNKKTGANKKPVQKKSLTIRGRSKNNVVLESENNEMINLASHEFMLSLESELKKTKIKIKTLEGIVNRMLVENNKVRTELNALKQILGRN